MRTRLLSLRRLFSLSELEKENPTVTNHRVPMVQTNHSPITFSPEFFADHAGNEQEGSDVQELVWRNGKLATQSYNQKSPFRQPDSTFFADSVPFSGVRPKLHLPDFVAVEETLASDVPPPPFWQEDEIASWFDHYPLDDALLPTGTSGVPGKTPPPEAGSPRHGNTMPESSQKKVINFSMFAMPAKLAGRKDAPPNRVAGTSERLELETCTVVDSCETPVVANSGKPYRYKSNVPVQATECSRDSGGRKNGSDSNESMRGMSTLRCKKRRNRESDGSHSHSEDAEDDESMSPGEGKRWSSKRRNRSTETHNLSERRRRDRINEKMRALQELLPQYNKSDKASLLDEAIEYLKSLQFQVQMMSMGYHMPHMMFPGHHSLMTSMGMARAMGMVAAGMAQALMPFTPNMLSASPHYTGLSSSIPQAVHPVPIPALCAKSESSFNTVSPTMTQPIPAEYRQFLGQLNMQVSPKVALAPNPSPSTSNETVPRSQ